MDEYIKREDALNVLACTVSTKARSMSTSDTDPIILTLEIAMGAVRSVPTADIVPKSEVEELIKSVDDMLDLVCAMTGLELTYYGKYAELKKKYVEGEG